MAQGDAREGKWRWNCRMEWVASTLHTTSERGVFSITTADAYTSAASSRLNWRPRADLNGLVPFRRKTKSGFYACAIIFQLASTPVFRCTERCYTELQQIICSARVGAGMFLLINDYHICVKVNMNVLGPCRLLVSWKAVHELTFWRRIFFLNFSTPCIQNVNNTGTKYVRIVKQTAFWRGKKTGSIYHV
jgi:hypothetical protein